MGKYSEKILFLLTLFDSWQVFCVHWTYISVLGVMYTQVKRHFTEDLNIWPVVIARLSNFTAFCMICNNTF